MKLIKEIQNFIRKLDQKSFKKYLIISISSIAIIMIISTYYIHNKSQSLIKNIENIEKSTYEISNIVKKFQITQNQKNHTLTLLDKEKDFEIKGFLEAFCKDHQLKYESNWIASSSSIEGNPKIEEVSLKATFKDQTTEKLVSILKALDEKEIVYIKKIKIDKGKNKLINFDLTIASLKYKHTVT